MFVDLRRISHPIKHDYNDHNHPVTTFADGALDMAGKKYFYKLDCSQAYHCLQVADEKFMQLVSLNFSARIFAYESLGQGLNNSLPAFSSIVCANLEPVVEKDRCAQYLDDIGIAAQTADRSAI